MTTQEKPDHATHWSLHTMAKATDRSQPGLPLKRGRCGTMTHDYKRNGTTTLFAALNTLDGTVIGDMMPKHRDQGLGGMGRCLSSRSTLSVLSASACSAYMFFTPTLRHEGTGHSGTGDSIDLQ